MILQQKTFKKYGYFPEQLTKGSNRLVFIKCDYCDSILERKYYQVIRGSRFTKKDCCLSQECITLKRKQSDLDNPNPNYNRKYVIDHEFFRWSTYKYWNI